MEAKLGITASFPPPPSSFSQQQLQEQGRASAAEQQRELELSLKVPHDPALHTALELEAGESGQTAALCGASQHITSVGNN